MGECYVEVFCITYSESLYTFFGFIGIFVVNIMVFVEFILNNFILI